VEKKGTERKKKGHVQKHVPYLVRGRGGKSG